MGLSKRLRQWWQVQTGEEDTPFDGDTPAWLVSLLFHLALLITVSLLSTFSVSRQISLTITAPVTEEEAILEVPQEFYFDLQPQEQIGANSLRGTEMAFSEAPELSEVSVEPTPVVETFEAGRIEIQEAVELATGLHLNENHFVRGAAGVGTTGASGAIDRLTQEILLSLQERRTLVVWMFDQSGSLDRQRREIYERFDRIYEELGVIRSSGNQAFAQHPDSPLLTSIVAFGQTVTERTTKPTDNLEEIKAAIEGIEMDDSGLERIFSAIYMAADKYRTYRVNDPETRQPKRNVMLVVFTDEVGDDQTGLEPTIAICRRYAMPVYVVGVPAPFGRKETMVKWVDPDPQYDQTPRWGRVDQGPETFLPERIKLHFAGSRDDAAPIDSGFGPFALTRLCYETGGIFFAVHPNRTVNRSVSQRETEEFSAHIEHFFDPQIMRRYRPDYVSPDEYQRRLSQNAARAALVQAAQMSWVTPMESPAMRFVKRSEGEFVNALTEAQKQAAKLEPKVEALYQSLRMGEADRAKESTPRWQAGYDLAMGRVMAVKVRTEAYNAMLAEAKRGVKFKQEKDNTITLQPDDAITAGSQLEKMAEKARIYLQRVIDEHPDTPWALLAKRELDEPLGWKWVESFTDVSPPREGGGNNNNPPPRRDDQLRMLPKPPPSRPVPKL